MLVGGRGGGVLIWLFKPKISPDWFVFPFAKEMSIKLNFTSFKNNL